MRPLHCLWFTTALLVPSLAHALPDQAAPAAPIPSEVRLSEAEKEKILEAAAANSREAPRRYVDISEADDEPKPQIHGEMGVEVGTGGYRSAYGTAIVPLKGDGVAIISVGSTNLGRQRYFDPWWR
jgi:hypothetical protein